MSQKKTVRVRFAPSPTGYLHVGGARTALYNYLFAKQQGGQFLLRIEDTDEVRSTDESLRMVIEDLQWLGLKWDEGPNPETLADVGPCGPYRQSRRLEIYKKVADDLINQGKAYYCFLKDEEIEKQREEALKEGRSPHVQSPYEDRPAAEALAKIKAGEKAVVRFKTKHLKKDYKFTDYVRGEVTFPSDMVGDFVLLRSGGMPVYNFCCAVDDHMMGITHVLRAEEHLPNTLRQLMIYEAMNWEIPRFGHMSLILDEDRKKLSKRKGATSCHEFKMEGYLPGALKNFIALLGWTHPEEKEIIPEEELIAKFSVDRLHPSGAVFDAVKLKWMNGQYLRAMDEAELWKLVEPFLARVSLELPSDQEWRKKSLQAFKPAMETLVDAIPLYRLLSDKSYALQPEADEVFQWEPTRKVLETWKALVSTEPSDVISEERFLQLQDMVKDQAQVKGKFLFMPIRVAVIGKPHGTELKILVPLMKKKSLVDRVDICLKKLG